MEKSNEDPLELQSKNKTVMDVMLENGMSDSDIREEAHTVISAVCIFVFDFSSYACKVGK